MHFFNPFNPPISFDYAFFCTDKSEDESEEEEEEGLEIRPDKQQQRGKDSLSRLLARSQPDESLRKRRHSLTSNSEHDSGTHCS